MSSVGAGGRATISVHRVRVGDDQLVAKTATGGARALLRAEAEVLGHLSELPVIDLVALRDGDDRTDLVTRDAGNATLARPTGLPPSAVLDALAAAADAVDRMHRAGWTHGALCAEHVVIGEDGRVTLCSLASARPADSDGVDRSDDLVQLMSIIDHAPCHADPSWSAPQRRWWERRTRQVAHRVHRERAAADAGTTAVAPLPAARIAQLLEAASHDTATAGGARVGGAAVGLLVGALALAAGALAWGALAWDAAASGARVDGPGPHAVPSTRPTHAEHPAAAPQCGAAAAWPSIDVDGDGCEDAVQIDGNLLRSGSDVVRAGRAGDQVAIAALDCADEAVLLVLRPSTGEVVGFDRWPAAGRPAHGRSLGSVEPASALATEDRGCHTAVVTLPDGRVLPLSDALRGGDRAPSVSPPEADQPTQDPSP